LPRIDSLQHTQVCKFGGRKNANKHQFVGIRVLGMVVEFLKNGRTALRRAEAALEAALVRESKMDGVYQRKIAEQFHQFRTPLQAMLCSTRILATETYGELGDIRYTDEAEAVHRSVLHLLRNTDPKRIKSGEGSRTKNSPRNEEVDAQDLIERVVMMFRQMAKNKEVDLTYEVDDDFPLLLTDPTQLQQVLISLISDGIEQTPSGGGVNMEAVLDPSGEAVILVIHDLGLGLPKEKLRKSLSPLDKNDDAENTGENLGLSIANRLMKEIGGEMTMGSMEGRGTLISLSFPIELTSAKPETSSQNNLSYPFSR